MNYASQHILKRTSVLPSQKIVTDPVSMCWWIVFCGSLIGLVVAQAGLQIEGPAIAVLSFAPLMYALERRLFPRLLIGPILMMYLYHALGYAIGPLWQLYAVGYLFGVLEDGFVAMQWGAVLALLTFALVFPRTFNWSKRIVSRGEHRQPKDLNYPDWSVLTLILTGLVAFALIYGFITGGANRLGGLTQDVADASIFSALTPLHYAAFFFLGYQAARQGTPWRFLWLMSFVAYSLFYFLDGGRGASAFAIMFSGLGWYWGGTPARRILVTIALWALLLVPISAIVLNYRDRTRDVGTDLQARAAGLIDAVTTFSSYEAGSQADSTAAFARGITTQFGDRVFVLTPDVIPFAGLEGVENAIYALTPLVINPNRPDLNDGNQMAIMYGAASAPRGSYLPAVAEGYRRAGWIGIIIFHAFIAIVFSFVLALIWTRRDNPMWLAMLMFVIFQSSQIMSLTVLGVMVLILWTLPRTFVTLWMVRQLQIILENLLRPRNWSGNLNLSSQRIGKPSRFTPSQGNRHERSAC